MMDKDYGPVAAEERPEEVHARINERMHRKLDVAQTNLVEACEWAAVNHEISPDQRNQLLGAVEAINRFRDDSSANSGASIVSAR
jgi:hypothetical protein